MFLKMQNVTLTQAQTCFLQMIESVVIHEAVSSWLKAKSDVTSRTFHISSVFDLSR